MTTPSAVMLKDARTSWLVGKEEKQDSRRREEEWLKIRLGTLNRVTAEVTTWWKETRVLRVLLVSLFLSFLFFSWARGNGLKRVCLRGWLGGCRRKIVGGILKRRSAGINSHMAYVLFFSLVVLASSCLFNDILFHLLARVSLATFFLFLHCQQHWSISNSIQSFFYRGFCLSVS